MSPTSCQAAVDIENDRALSPRALAIDRDIGSSGLKTPPDLDNTILPSPLASFVSFATRSTGLGVRVTSAIGGYGLDATRLTTLTALRVGRSLFDGVLGRAGKEPMVRSNPEAVAGGNIDDIDKIHTRVDKLILWAAAVFRFADTALFTVSEGSQLALSTLDQFLGSTDSSRATAGIITMIRREVANPPTAGPGETVSVGYLVAAFCALAYLQRSCRTFLEEEDRKFCVDEIVWDVIVLDDGTRVDISKENVPHQPATVSPPKPEDGPNLDDPSTGKLEHDVLQSLPDNAKVSITREITISETIRVNYTGNVQQIKVDLPPGIELIEDNRDTDRAQAGQEGTTAQLIFRSTRRRQSTMSYQTVDRELNLAAERVGKPGLQPPECLASRDSHVPGETEINLRQPAILTNPFHVTSSQPSQDSNSSFAGEPSCAADTAPPSQPNSRPGLPPQRVLSNKPLSGASRKEPGSGPKLLEKISGFRTVLTRSRSISSKQDPRREAAAGKAKLTFLASLTARFLGRADCQPTSLSPWLSLTQKGSALATSKGGPEEPEQGRSHTMCFSIHERLQQSTVSLDGSAVTTDNYQSASVFTEAAASPGVKIVSSEPGLDHEHLTSTDYHNKSPTPSIYTLPAHNSEISLVSHHRKTTRAAEKLSALRQAGVLPGMFPERHFLGNIARYMRFASAAYGSYFIELLGISTELPLPGILEDTHHELRSFAHHTRSAPGSILLSSFVDPQGGSDGTGATNTGVPLVHYISLDHESKAVVLACRGTLGFEDVLADMACEYDDLVWRGTAYKVHKGVHASAKRLLFGSDGRVLRTLKAALQDFPAYGLVLTGHSLGAAVTSVLGIMLSEPGDDGTFITAPSPLTNPSSLPSHPDSDTTLLLSTPPPHLCLPAHRPIHVYAYGPPATLSLPLRAATRGLITTVVHGSDLVPYLSLGLLHDFQALALALKADNDAAGDESGDDARDGDNAAGDTAGDNDSDAAGDTARDGDGDTAAGDGAGDEEGFADRPPAGDDEWAWASLRVLRMSMGSEKLVPPGEVFVVEGRPVPRRREGGGEDHLGQPARRMVLRYVRDVERRFGEVRFAGGMLTDHSPARYEAALERLMMGVGMRE
ncbi:hypothetical protein C8A01DRAFT_16481 [Parachaetomium inaequale]|uniref:sn-1-specific diacylglycerol lipase n=1 Tax=Parachaetomium inaequale TaxID=2588326 RepID=A0AAN6SRM7_9PEZI|nr:hypothetical protein C8A01DRAFT_16481 [Parachaetomium inaequale]